MSEDYYSGHDGRKKRKYKNKYKRGGKYRSVGLDKAKEKKIKKK